MAYWSSTGFDDYAAKDDLRNVKPRWQELAEFAEFYTTPSSTFSTPPALEKKRNIGHMDRYTLGYDNGDNGLWSKRPRAHSDNVASLGASRSRSRSRPSRPRTRMFENSAASTQHRSRSTAGQRYGHTHPTQNILLPLLALAIVLLSCLCVPAFRSSGLTSTYVEWPPQNGSFVGEVRDHVCNIPLVPEVLDCGHLPGMEVSKNTSIRHVIPGIINALSENPDTVDEIFDILEDIKRDLFAIQNTTMETTVISVDHLLNLTSVLEADLIDWENGKDYLLATIQTKIISLNLDDKYQVFLKRFRVAVIHDLDDIAKGLEQTQKIKLNAATITWSLLLQDTPYQSPWSDAGPHEDTPTIDQLSLLRRLALWSILFITKTPDVKPFTTAQRTKLIHDKVFAIIPILKAMHVSNDKAHTSIITARNLVQRRISWLSELMGMVAMVERRNQKFDHDLLGGLMEMKNLVPMLMEQRKGQRVDRKYIRSMARAKEDAKEDSKEDAENL